MHDSIAEPSYQFTGADQQTTLFAWRGSGIVLFGERNDDRWILARGWLNADRLEDVRRWSFAQPVAFSGQVRRLVKEATGDVNHARDEGHRALAWAETAS
jgi:hypothetical protein